jgi:hypothetical protein
VPSSTNSRKWMKSREAAKLVKPVIRKGPLS